jgi:hypothetical protein
MTTIRFHDVGRDKAAWAVACAHTRANVEGVERTALLAVKRKGVLISRGIDVVYDSEANEGAVIVGGWRMVGRFTLEDA